MLSSLMVTLPKECSQVLDKDISGSQRWKESYLAFKKICMHFKEIKNLKVPKKKEWDHFPSLQQAELNSCFKFVLLLHLPGQDTAGFSYSWW